MDAGGRVTLIQLACLFFQRSRVLQVPLGQFEYMGYTMTNSKYRFTAWVPWDNTTMKVDWSRTAAKELYNITGELGSSKKHSASLLEFRDSLNRSISIPKCDRHHCYCAVCLAGYDPSNFDFPGLSHNIVNQTSVADIVASMYQQLQNAVNNWY